jgi:nucleotide-binding universal stress UspA family protein
MYRELYSSCPSVTQLKDDLNNDPTTILIATILSATILNATRLATYRIGYGVGMKILVAVDSTDVSHHTARVARHLFPNAEHVVLSAAAVAPYVFSEPFSGAMYSGVPTMTELNASETAADEATSSAKRILGGATETLVDVGDPGSLICDEARAHNVDAIVVGRGEKTWLTRIFQPSVSEFVIKHAPCPVLVVREPDEA